MYGADPEEIIVFNGGAEALLALFFVRGEPGANVIVPTPSFAPFVEVPAALGVETRRYALRFENGFALDRRGGHASRRCAHEADPAEHAA